MTDADQMAILSRAGEAIDTLLGTSRGERVSLPVLSSSVADVPVLVAEVRRLRGLVDAAEWAAGMGDERDWVISGACPWCGGVSPDDKNFSGVGHAPTCPAFGATSQSPAETKA